MKLKGKADKILKAFFFFLALGIAIMIVQWPLGVDHSRSYENEQLFLKEKPKSLDCVFIGSSNVHAFWQPVFGWDQHGIKTWNYSIDLMNMATVKYMLIEARKTQPDALYVICLNVFKKESSKTTIQAAHWLLDYMPWSLNKARIIRTLANESELTFAEKMELFFPIIRFHSRWDSLGAWAFGAEGKEYKSSLRKSLFVKQSKDVSNDLQYYSSSSSVPEETKSIMDDVLDYCDANNVKVLFMKVPHVASEEEQGRLNKLESYVESKGYSCVDLFEIWKDLYLDLTQDYYNEGHTNVHGSIKISTYLGNYLVEHYGFEDKRGQEDSESWDQASKDYKKYLDPYVLPFEGQALRIDLSAPSVNKLSVHDQQIIVSWKESPETEKYGIYRSDGTHWEFVAETDQLEYIDEGLKAATKYTYTVVPIVVQEGVKYYGHFNVKGVSATTGGAKE